ncbi:malic enzyme [Gigaspora rosea]|uniref:Malic enzyme n=1 Tax=Gigaspora rosea TaxID=44941 RepID=A0A397UPN6_9GLOM|nr:malic enzyme [Gigaspora rosea]
MGHLKFMQYLNFCCCCIPSFENVRTATPLSTRNALHLTGILPSAVENLDQQKKRALSQLRAKSSSLEKYIFLAWLRNTNIRLFYRLVIDELEEMAPLIYTPTVGSACLEYSHIYPFLAPPGVPDGLYLSINDLPNLTQIIKNYRPYPFNESLTPQIAVITDGSRILGLGDLGVNGMGIPIGKLQLYVAGAGIDPRRTLPITIDCGTNNEKNLNDEFYLGIRKKRVSDEEFYPFVDAVLKALTSVYPDLLVQFEDFSSEHAFDLLTKYRDNLFCFNDDIQGTGAVVLSGFINAVRLVEKDVHPTKHRILFFGAGSAGVGVAKQLLEFFKIEHGMSEEEAKKLVWLVDTKGLVTSDRGDKLASHKVYLSRSDNEGRQYKSLMDVIEYVKPTVLIGLSSTGGVFDETVLKRMAELNKNPIIFPLSNPMVNAECTFEDAMRNTDNRVIFASGTGFPPFVEQVTGKIRYPGQGNNMYIFPGLGLGAIIARPVKITDRQIYASASALAESLTKEEYDQNFLYPAVQRIRRVSAEVAAAVVVTAVDEGLARNPEINSMVKKDLKELLSRSGEKWQELIKYVEERMWDPNHEKAFPTESLIEKSKF